ncbi:MAG TPA: hypothetical protein VFD84_11040 [Candidatus Binatia bacterium]|jgi:hypothetical protein|nr:hypothetical protein [Candidatus Binatia bacterium]
MGEKIFVGNLALDTTSAELESLLSEAARTPSVSEAKERASGNGGGRGRGGFGRRSR